LFSEKASESQNKQEEAMSKSKSSTASVSEFSETTMPPVHPLMLQRAILEDQRDELDIQVKVLKDALEQIELVVNSPTFNDTEVAKSSVFIGSTKTGKFRQLHKHESGSLYYLTQSFIKVKVPKGSRPIFKNAKIRTEGNACCLNNITL
jgi:hypothetical protein